MQLILKCDIYDKILIFHTNIFIYYNYLVSKIVVFLSERGDCKCDKVKAGNLRMLNLSCSQDKSSSARLIFLWTKDTFTGSPDWEAAYWSSFKQKRKKRKKIKLHALSNRNVLKFYFFSKIYMWLKKGGEWFYKHSYLLFNA